MSVDQLRAAGYPAQFVHHQPLRIHVLFSAGTTEALHYNPITQQTSNVNQKTAVNICCACSVCSLNQQKKLRIVYVLLLKDIRPQQQCSETKSSRLLLLRFLSLHYLYPQPGCVNMRPHEREYIIQVQAQNERPGVMNAGCGSDRFEYVMRNPALAVCGVHGINNTVCN